MGEWDHLDGNANPKIEIKVLVSNSRALSAPKASNILYGFYGHIELVIIGELLKETREWHLSERVQILRIENSPLTSSNK